MASLTPRTRKRGQSQIAAATGRLHYCLSMLDMTWRPQQPGFTACHSTIDAILALCELSEIYRESDHPLHVAYLDIKAEFWLCHSADRQALWKVVRSSGVPGILLNLIEALHHSIETSIRYSKKFPLGSQQQHEFNRVALLLLLCFVSPLTGLKMAWPTDQHISQKFSETPLLCYGHLGQSMPVVAQFTAATRQRAATYNLSIICRRSRSSVLTSNIECSMFVLQPYSLQIRPAFSTLSRSASWPDYLPGPANSPGLVGVMAVSFVRHLYCIYRLGGGGRANTLDKWSETAARHSRR